MFEGYGWMLECEEAVIRVHAGVIRVDVRL